MNTLLTILLGAFLFMLNPFLLVLLPFVLWIVNAADNTEKRAGGCAGHVVFIALMGVFAVVAILMFGVVAGTDCPTAFVNQAMGRCP